MKINKLAKLSQADSEFRLNHIFKHSFKGPDPPALT
jgi:hypothetical protein